MAGKQKLKKINLSYIHLSFQRERAQGTGANGELGHAKAVSEPQGAQDTKPTGIRVLQRGGPAREPQQGKTTYDYGR